MSDVLFQNFRSGRRLRNVSAETWWVSAMLAFGAMGVVCVFVLWRAGVNELAPAYSQFWAARVLVDMYVGFCCSLCGMIVYAVVVDPLEPPLSSVRPRLFRWICASVGLAWLMLAGGALGAYLVLRITIGDVTAIDPNLYELRKPLSVFVVLPLSVITAGIVFEFQRRETWAAFRSGSLFQRYPRITLDLQRTIERDADGLKLVYTWNDAVHSGEYYFVRNLTIAALIIGATDFLVLSQTGLHLWQLPTPGLLLSFGWFALVTGAMVESALKARVKGLVPCRLEIRLPDGGMTLSRDTRAYWRRKLATAVAEAFASSGRCIQNNQTMHSVVDWVVKPRAVALSVRDIAEGQVFINSYKEFHRISGERDLSAKYHAIDYVLIERLDGSKVVISRSCWRENEVDRIRAAVTAALNGSVSDDIPESVRAIAEQWHQDKVRYASNPAILAAKKRRYVSTVSA